MQENHGHKEYIWFLCKAKCNLERTAHIENGLWNASKWNWIHCRTTIVSNCLRFATDFKQLHGSFGFVPSRSCRMGSREQQQQKRITWGWLNFSGYLVCKGLLVNAVSGDRWAVVAGEWSEGLIEELSAVNGRAQAVVKDAVSFAISINLLTIEAGNSSLASRKGNMVLLLKSRWE